MRLGVGQRVGRWELLRELGAGGNGAVWEAIREEERVAIKLLHRNQPARYQRFRHEVAALRRLNGRDGIMPILEEYLPDRPTDRDPAWFAMPLAKPIAGVLRDARLEGI